MRILHLTDHYLPVLGGIETHVDGLARRQHERDDDVTVLTSTPGRGKEDPRSVRVIRARSFLEATVVAVHSMWNGMGPLPALAATTAGLRGAPVHWTAVSRAAATHLATQLPGWAHVSVLPNAVDTEPRTCTPAPRPDRPVQLISTTRLASETALCSAGSSVGSLDRAWLQR